MLIFLSITMLIGSFISGLIPLTLTLSESKMKHITILGAGLLIGTALAVIIPEGIHTLYSNAKHIEEKIETKGHIHQRSLSKRSVFFEPNSDEYLIELFHNQISANNQTNKLIKRFLINHSDYEKIQLFLNQVSAHMNVNRQLRNNDFNEINLSISRLNNHKNIFIKRLSMTSQDYEKFDRFLNQTSAQMRLNKMLIKRDLTEHDIIEINLFLSRISAQNTNTRLIKRMILTNEDHEKLELFLNQLSANVNMPKLLRSVDKNKGDKYLIELFHSHIYDVNQIVKLVKREELTEEDYEKLQVFLNRLSANKSANKLLDKRTSETTVHSNTEMDTFSVNLLKSQLQSKTYVFDSFDYDKLELVLNRMFSNISANKVIRSIESDQYLMELFINRLSAGNRNTRLIKRIALNKEDYNKIDIFLSQISAHMNMPKVIDRVRRAVGDSQDKKPENMIKSDENIKDKTKTNNDHDEDHSHGQEESGPAHSSIGVTLVLGFIFMLIVDQIGGKVSHRPHTVLDTQAIRNKITFTTTLGLVVHSAADGIALGAAAATSRTDVEMIVFIAIMLHKAPAAFGLVSFLIHEGLERARVRKHLTIFAMAAPIMAIVTFAVLKSQNSLNLVTSDSTGLCMLFSAGTFLYVSTVHVLPEVQSHNEDRGFKLTETLSFIAGSIIPLILSVGHSH